MCVVTSLGLITSTHPVFRKIPQTWPLGAYTTCARLKNLCFCTMSLRYPTPCFMLQRPSKAAKKSLESMTQLYQWWVSCVYELLLSLTATSHTSLRAAMTIIPGPYILCPWASIWSTWVPNVDQMNIHGHKMQSSTLHLKHSHQWKRRGPTEYISELMQDGCKVYMDSSMASCVHCHVDYSQKPPLRGRFNTKPGDHGTLNDHKC